MWDKKNCPICDSKEIDGVKISAEGPLDQEIQVICPICGRFRISSQAFYAVQNEKNIEQRYLLSGITRSFNLFGQRGVYLKEDDLPSGPNFPGLLRLYWDGTITGKINCVIHFLAQKSHFPGKTVEFDYSRDYPLSFSRTDEEFYYYLRYLDDSGILDIDFPMGTSSLSGKLTVDGWRAFEEKTQSSNISKQVFVAMSFDEVLKPVFTEGIEPLETELEYEFIRVDMDQFNGKICDKIVSLIKKSCFLIADVTQHKQGVYFEAGLAMGLGIPVIWTCRKDDLRNAHFDTRQYNHIVWENMEELREKLRDRIYATIQKDLI